MTTKKKPAARRAAAASRAAKAPASVALMLNGQAVGQRSVADLGSQTIGEVANSIAREHGLKSYSILIDGVKVTTEQAGRSLAAAHATSLEVFAKETRG